VSVAAGKAYGTSVRQRAQAMGHPLSGEIHEPHNPACRNEARHECQGQTRLQVGKRVTADKDDLIPAERPNPESGGSPTDEVR